MLEINIADVVNVLNICKPYLISFAVILVAVLVTIIAAQRAEKFRRKLIRSQAGIALLLALVVIVNLICFGPMSTMISLATGSGSIKEETSSEAMDLCTEIAEEGIVLLKNEGNILPLKQQNKLNVFGWASTNPCYGGTGSGSISDSYEKVTLLQGLEETGFELNDELSEFYTSYRADRPAIAGTGGSMGVDFSLPEPPVNEYTDELLTNAKEFSDTALVVVSRVGGEGVDLPKDVSESAYTDNSEEYKDFEDGEHYLQLSRTESDMLRMVCDNFENVIVIYNGANTMELGFLDEYEQIKGAIWCPGPGQNGFLALGEILNGTINPSAKTSDIFVKDLTATPSYNNIGNFVYSNAEEFASEGRNSTTGEPQTIYPTFVNYSEGIYTGYRYYETASDDGKINYYDEVMYPFGYGLSYTTFSQEMKDFSEENGQISFSVEVTNTGDCAGKDVVEVYYNPPYENQGIEKASANLIAFEKTELLDPGASQTIEISFAAEDMASYDAEGKGCYVLEDGDYGISIRSDSHTIIAEEICHVGEDIVFDENNPRSTDDIAATNQFDEAKGDVIYLSRADGFANFEEATAAPENLEMSDEIKSMFNNSSTYDPKEYNDESDEMPVAGAENGIELADLRGVDYDDEQWDKLLDELTPEEMDSLIALAGYQTLAIESINKVQTVDCDGPAAINNNFTGVGSIGFPGAVVIANTWNTDIAERYGESIGKMASEMGVSGWYAPSVNGHRSAFGGRNFEYYSEDGLLSGKMAAKAIIGAEKYGIYSYVKHFAVNEQETNRHNMLCTWIDEQTLREIYLKPFEIAVKEGGADAMMSAFNYIGATWSGGSGALLNNVLRGEWGFRGFVVTDYFGPTYFMNADQAIRNGNDAMLVAYDTPTNHVKDKESATGLKAMRQAAKNILYTVVNSRAYDAENVNSGLMNWQIAAIVIDASFAVVIIGLEIVAFRKYRRRIGGIAKNNVSEQ